ncbi:MAG: TIGR03905 family TSCPD domain-containing protein [Clostridia bacterium]|nr:TIGR03905 family TSCPD domain-containing protein [Clostridia bacterium]
MEYTYKTRGGVCSRSIRLVLEGGIIREVRFEGGCQGNTQGLQTLVAGMPAEEIIRKLKNIKCGRKKSSCPDQLATALEEALKKSRI